jgi:molecular chaperone DnaJ
MAEKRDYYEVLGIGKDAKPDEIKRAYLKLAKQYHPDLNKSPDAPAKFKEVTEAYEVLSDEKKRAAYDQFGFAGVDPQAGGANGQGGFGQGFSGFGDFDDIFSSLFGQGARSSSRGGRSSGPVKGNDQVMKIRISFMDAIKGTDVELPVSYDDMCPDCHGTGAKNGDDFDTCPYCHGTGTVRTQQRSIFGIVEQQTVCSHCHGTGRVVKHPCPTCSGQGYVHHETKLSVHIPSGIDDGEQIRISGKGLRGYNGGPSGDLYIVVAVASDKNFKRDGNDIHVTVPLSVLDLLLGTTLSVPTVYDSCEVKVNPSTPVDAVLRIKGQGIKARNGYSNNGDEYVHLDVRMPDSLTEEEKDLLIKVHNIEDTKPQNKNDFDKWKSFFRKK